VIDHRSLTLLSTHFCNLLVVSVVFTLSFRFGDFFDTPAQNSAAPQALGFDGFFKGAYSYHFHNFWYVRTTSILLVSAPLILLLDIGGNLSIPPATGRTSDLNSKPGRTLHGLRSWKSTTAWNPAQRAHTVTERKRMPTAWSMTSGTWTGQLYSKGHSKRTYVESARICMGSGCTGSRGPEVSLSLGIFLWLDSVAIDMGDSLRARGGRVIVAFTFLSL
jgi:hypothetical protein